MMSRVQLMEVFLYYYCMMIMAKRLFKKKNHNLCVPPYAHQLFSIKKKRHCHGCSSFKNLAILFGGLDNKNC